MENDKANKLEIGSLFNNFPFRIPIYQRNYSWGEQEISQLLIDINEANEKYYLGTLVLYKNNYYYDVIDGQQRLTTLYLIHKVISTLTNKEFKIENRLSFESRPKITSFLENLLSTNFSILHDNTKGLQNFTTAITEIHRFFEQDLENDLASFSQKFLKQTFIFSTILPEKTDVNHYFEIMNNRGEQLKKHEILKAKFIEELEDKYCKKRFSKIWEACSQMGSHVQFFFDDSNRKKIFGQNLDTFPDDKLIEEYLSIPDKENTSSNHQNNNPEFTGEAILKNHTLDKNFKQGNENNHTENLKSIIDFENFMLQVLKLMNGYRATNLVDKDLLNNFGYEKNHIKFPNSFNFIKILLQTRYLFDKYIIKQEINENNDDDWSWSILSFSSYENTFKQNNSFPDKTWNKKLIMIQSMFQVTYATNTNKTWLHELLSYLYNSNDNHAEDIFDFIFNRMKWRFNKSGFKKSQGTQTPRAVFNFLDFLLWDEYQNRIKNQSLNSFNKIYLNKINQSLRSNFSNFKFTQRNSIEHFFPQSKKADLPIEKNIDKKKNIIDSFGNLCLISSRNNSSYNKEHPSFKKRKGRTTNESLKQQIMFEMMEGNSWGQTQIEKHENEMMELLNSKFTKVNKKSKKSQTNEQAIKSAIKKCF